VKGNQQQEDYVKPNDLKLLPEEKGYCTLNARSEPLKEDDQGYLIPEDKNSGNLVTTNVDKY